MARKSSSPVSLIFIRAPKPVKSFDDVDKVLDSLIIAIGSALRQVQNDIVTNVVYPTNYFGDPDKNGSWRVTIIGNDLVAERRESGSWVKKGAFTA